MTHSDSRHSWSDYVATGLPWILSITARRALRAGQARVGSEHVLIPLLDCCPIMFFPSGLTKHSVVAALRDWDLDSDDGEQSNDLLDVPAEVTDATTADLREASARVNRFDVARGSLRRLWRSELVAAVQRAVALAQAEGVWQAHAVHLLRAILADEESRAVQALASAGVRPQFILSDIPDDLSPREALPDTAVVHYLDQRRWIKPHAPLPVRSNLRGRMRWSWMHLRNDLKARPRQNDILTAVLAEAIRTGIRLGHGQIDSAHLVVALAALEDHLAANGQRLISRAASLDTAGQLLREHGIGYRAAYEAAAITCGHLAGPGIDAPELVPEALRRTRTLTDRMKATKWPYVGTTAILHAALAEPDDAAAQLVRALGASPITLASQALRDLDNVIAVE